MPISITVVDDATIPSSATVTVIGSAGGIVSVYSGGFDKDGSIPWNGPINRTGDGTVTLFLNPGLYLFYAKEDDDVSVVIPLVVTDGLDAVLTRIRLAIIGILNALALPNLYGGIIPGWTPQEVEARFPCIFLTHENVTPTRAMNIQSLSDVGYPVRVVIADKLPRTDSSRMADYDRWRQKITRAFDGQRLPGVREVITTTIEDDVYGNQDTVKFETMVSELVIRCTAREPTGIGA